MANPFRRLFDFIEQKEAPQRQSGRCGGSEKQRRGEKRNDRAFSNAFHAVPFFTPRPGSSPPSAVSAKILILHNNFNLSDRV